MRRRQKREELLEQLALVSGLLDEQGRALFIIDPDKYMRPGSEDEWRLVVEELPSKIKFVFAQRPDDRLAVSSAFLALDNAVRIPPEPLSPLDQQSVDELIDYYGTQVTASPPQLRAALERYHGHPYAVEGALKLLRAGETIGALPADPTPTHIAAEQWRRVRQAGTAAIHLFRAYAILEVPVPSDLAETVADVGAETRLSVLADRYLDGLLAREPDGESIYHALLADHVRDEIADDQASRYHERAQEAYRLRLNADTKPDALAAARLPLHVLATGDVTSFATTLTDECMGPLLTLGLYDQAEALSRQALELVSPGSAAAAAVAGNLGNVYQTRGDLDQAEAMYRKSLAINEKLGRLEGMANQYGNLGILYETRGKLDEARKLWVRAREIFQQIGMPHMAARLEGWIDGLEGKGSGASRA